MKAETQIIQPISNPNQIKYIEPEIRKCVRHDLELAIKGGAVVFEIKTDVFKLMLKVVIKKENIEKIKKSIEDSENDWFDCLKKANGNYRKALKLYENY